MKFAKLSQLRTDMQCCHTETWLTEHLLNNALFLDNYVVFRNDRPTRSSNSTHGGVLVAVHTELTTHYHPNSFPDSVVVSINLQNAPILVCRIYCPPSNSPYQWTLVIFRDRMQFPLSNKPSNLRIQKIEGDINFSGGNWETMKAPDPHEATTLNYFLNRDFQQLLDSKLDIVMCDRVKGVTKSPVASKTSRYLECMQAMGAHAQTMKRSHLILQTGLETVQEYPVLPATHSTSLHMVKPTGKVSKNKGARELAQRTEEHP